MSDQKMGLATAPVLSQKLRDLGDGTYAASVWDESGGGGGGGGTVTTSNATSSALEGSHVVKASAGKLYRATVFNGGASGQYYQLHDAASLPADTAVPIEPIYVPANSAGSWDFAAQPRSFATGIVVTNSSTGAMLTHGGNDSLFDAQYV